MKKIIGKLAFLLVALAASLQAQYSVTLTGHTTQTYTSSSALQDCLNAATNPNDKCNINNSATYPVQGTGVVFAALLKYSGAGMRATPSVTVTFSGSTITRSAGSFITDGFITGNVEVKGTALNNGNFTVTNVAATELTVSETLTAEGPLTGRAIVRQPITLTKTAGQTPKVNGIQTNGKSWWVIKGNSRNILAGTKNRPDPGNTDELEITDYNWGAYAGIYVYGSSGASTNIEFRYLWVHEIGQGNQACFKGPSSGPYPSDISILDSDIEFCSARRPSTWNDRYGNPGACTPGTGCGNGGLAIGINAARLVVRNVDVSHTVDALWPNGDNVTANNVTYHDSCGSSFAGGYDQTGQHKMCEPDLVDSTDLMHWDYVQPTAGATGVPPRHIVIENGEERDIPSIQLNSFTTSTYSNLSTTTVGGVSVLHSATHAFSEVEVGWFLLLRGGTNYKYGYYRCVSISSGDCVMGTIITTGGELTGNGVGDFLYPTGSNLTRTWFSTGGACPTCPNDLAATNAANSVLTSASYTFQASDAGKAILIKTGTHFVQGWYIIQSVSGGAATLTSNATDGTDASGGSGAEYPRATNGHVGVWQDVVAEVDASASQTLTFSSSGNTITRSSGSWISSGFVNGDIISVGGTSSNNGFKVVSNVTAGVLTVNEALVNEGPLSSTANVNRTVGSAGLTNSIYRYNVATNVGEGLIGMGFGSGSGVKTTYVFQRSVIYNSTFTEFQAWRKWAGKQTTAGNQWYRYSANGAGLNNIEVNTVSNNGNWAQSSLWDPTTVRRGVFAYLDPAFYCGGGACNWSHYPFVDVTDTCAGYCPSRTLYKDAEATTGQNPLFTTSTDFHLQDSSPALSGAVPLALVDASDGGGTTLTITYQPAQSTYTPNTYETATYTTGGTDFFQDGQNGTVKPDCIAFIHAGGTYDVGCIIDGGILDGTHMELTSAVTRSPGDAMLLYSDAFGNVVFDPVHPYYRGALSSIGPRVVLDPMSIAFGDQTTGTHSASQNITLTNTGGTTLNITSILFADGTHFEATSNTCLTTLAPSTSCITAVRFKPQTDGAKTDSLVYTTDASGSPHSVALSGTGITNSPSPSGTITPSSLAPRFGDTLTLTFSSTNADACTLMDDVGNTLSTATSGAPTVTVDWQGPRVYTLTCTNANGTGGDSKIVRAVQRVGSGVLQWAARGRIVFEPNALLARKISREKLKRRNYE